MVGGVELAPAAAGIGEPTVGVAAASASRRPARLASVAGDTCHVDVIDRWGNMVSATPSGGWLQSSPVIPELGFCLGTRLQISWLDEGSPSSLQPGKRPRSTLSPTLAFKDGEPYMAFGTPGGDGQDQWSLQLFLHHVHHGMNLQEAIDCPEFNTEHAPSSFYPRAANPGISRSKAASRRRRAQRSPIAAIACRSARPGRAAVSPPAPARRRRTAASSRPAPTRAACRATPSADRANCRTQQLTRLALASLVHKS